MSLEGRRAYPQRMRGQYRRASRAEKSIHLDGMEQVTQMHRKSLIRLLNGPSWKDGTAVDGGARSAASMFSTALLFPVLRLCPDNGNMFLNHHLQRF